MPLASHLRDIVQVAIGHRPPARAVVLYDARSPLARLLTGGYREALPDAKFVDFDAHDHAEVLAILAGFGPGDLAVLIQSTRFDLREFRFRLELFRAGLAVIEHPHLGRVADDEVPRYVDALAYDPGYYRTVGPALKRRIDGAARIEVRSADATLAYDGPFEPSKLNVGDYTGFPAIGGQFPIGEVFTEPVALDGVQGAVRLFAFGGDDFGVRFPTEPFLLEIDRGYVTGAPGAPDEFHAVLAAIRDREGAVRVRELGFGLNRAFTREERVTDVGTYERMCGVHLSLGAKHPVYPKAGYPRRAGHFHVDVFADAREVRIDGERVYDGARYTVT